MNNDCTCAFNLFLLLLVWSPLTLFLYRFFRNQTQVSQLGKTGVSTAPFTLLRSNSTSLFKGTLGHWEVVLLKNVHVLDD